MTKLAICIGGAKNIEGVLRYHEKLGFDKKDNFRLAAHNGGSQNLKTVFKKYDRLLDAGMQHEQIIQITGRAGGAKNVKVFLEHKILLIDELKFETKQVARILSQNKCSSHGGSHNIKLMAKYKNEIKEFGLKRYEITELLMKGKEGREEFVTLIENKKAAKKLESPAVVAKQTAVEESKSMPPSSLSTAADPSPTEKTNLDVLVQLLEKEMSTSKKKFTPTLPRVADSPMLFNRKRQRNVNVAATERHKKAATGPMP